MRNRMQIIMKKSKEIQKNYFSSKQHFPTAGHNGFEVICEVRIIPTVTYGE